MCVCNDIIINVCELLCNNDNDNVCNVNNIIINININININGNVCITVCIVCGCEAVCVMCV